MGEVAQSVTCLAVDMCQTADPVVESSILTRSHAFMEIDCEIISMVILFPSAVSRMVVSYKQKYVHKVLVNFFGQAQETSVVRLTDHPNMIIAVDWDIKSQTKQKKMDNFA